jgi:uncharacterized protein with GYD domain
MPTSAMFTTLSPDGGHTLHMHPDRLRAVDDELTVMGCRVIAQYALLGRYDFLTLIEAPDAETVAHLSVDLASRGTAHFETMQAIPLDSFIEKLKDTSSLGGVESRPTNPRLQTTLQRVLGLRFRRS